MKEFVEKLIERLEEYKYTHLMERDSEQCLHCTEINCESGTDCTFCVIDKAKEIVNELAEEYNQEPFTNFETIRRNRLDCEVPSDCFEQIKEVRVIDEWTEETKVFNQDSTKNNQGWIPCIGCESCEYKECEHHGKV